MVVGQDLGLFFVHLQGVQQRLSLHFEGLHKRMAGVVMVADHALRYFGSEGAALDLVGVCFVSFG